MRQKIDLKDFIVTYCLQLSRLQKYDIELPETA